jgi:hypothetical protein
MSLIGTATLTGTYQTPEIATGILVGPFLVHQGGAWVLTHRKSGFGFGVLCCCPVKAILVAEAAEPILDWDRDPKALRQDPHWKDVLPAVRAIICPLGCNP